MELIWVKLKGFKRFENATLNTTGKVIAILGPNEAGKSSILQALTRLNDDEPLNKDVELTRDKEFSDDHIVIEGAFLLDDEDRQAIADLYEGESVKWLYIKKPVSGRRQFEIQPSLPEQTDNNVKLIDILRKRVPWFLVFDGSHRDLKSHESVPSSRFNNWAIINLLKIAQIDISQIDSALLDNPSKLRSLVNKANQRISDIYQGKWSQSKVKPVIDINNKIIRILIENEQQEAFEPEHRSDGLRQFVALINFLEAQQVDNHILLVDEAELHLHYDAQADLIQMFTKQNFSAKIIYTTHSVGCLPEDLGTGVKLVCPVENEAERSDIKKHFWSVDKRPKVLPLLFGLGMNNLAFIAIRQTVFVEGPTEMLLLPTLLRQAVNIDHLGFQILPGIVETKNYNFGLLDNYGSKFVFLLDNNQLGNEYETQLKESGIEEKRILTLPKLDNLESTVLEDYIRQDLYLEAVNNELNKLNNKEFSEQIIEEEYKKGDLKMSNKISIAYYLLDLATEERQEMLITEEGKDKLKELYESIGEILKIGSNLK